MISGSVLLLTKITNSVYYCIICVCLGTGLCIWSQQVLCRRWLGLVILLSFLSSGIIWWKCLPTSNVHTTACFWQLNYFDESSVFEKGRRLAVASTQGRIEVWTESSLLKLCSQMVVLSLVLPLRSLNHSDQIWTISNEFQDITWL